MLNCYQHQGGIIQVDWFLGVSGEGARILNGLTDPIATQGKNGDYYINTATQVLYEKKVGAWSQVMTLGGNPAQATAIQDAFGNPIISLDANTLSQLQDSFGNPV